MDTPEARAAQKPKCEVPCGSPEAPYCLCEKAYERGLLVGAQMRVAGNNYGKVRGSYPSNPYHRSDPCCEQYNAGYEEGFSA